MSGLGTFLTVSKPDTLNFNDCFVGTPYLWN
jgi:hypothetical protein